MYCEICNEEFYPRNKTQRFCSIKCVGRYNSRTKSNQKETQCAWCGKKIYLPSSSLRKKNYCSRQHNGFANAVRMGANIVQIHEEMESIKWNNAIAYLVGLIATDGTLRKNRKQIKISNKDSQLMNDVKEIVLSITGREQIVNEYYAKYKGKAYKHYQLQFTSYPLYDFLLKIGLTPNKTKTIQSVDLPNHYFADFFRGVIDGDGNYNFHNNTEIIYIRIYSGSESFLHWLNEMAIEVFNISGGKIHYEKRTIGSRYILYFQSTYDLLRIIEAIYNEEVYSYKGKKRKAEYMLNNMIKLKEKYKKNQIGTMIVCSYSNCKNEFIAVTQNHMYCKKHKY